MFIGLIADTAIWVSDGNPVAPYNVAIAVLACGIVLCVANWSENYGETDVQMTQNLLEALRSVFGDWKVLLLGIAQSVFEGAMYTFVFMWTPTMTQGGNSIPHGIVFSSFMVACGIGGCLFAFLLRWASEETIMPLVFIVSAGVRA